MRLIKSCIAVLIIASGGISPAKAASKVDFVNFSINNCLQHFDQEKNDEFRGMSDAQKVENIFPLIELFVDSSQESLEKDIQSAPAAMACLAQQVLKIKRNNGDVPSDLSSTATTITSNDVAACSEEIQGVQISSQQWSGSSDDVAAKLGQFQKALFEGRCAGHPEAAAYIASASRMIGYGGNSEGAGGGVLPLAASSNATASRDASRTHKVHNPAADAKPCTLITGDGNMAAISTRGGWQLANQCGVPIEAFWCVVSPEGQCKNGGTWTIARGNSWSIQEGGQSLRWGACKGRDGGGFDSGSNGEKYTCHLLSWD